jgi:hypothetical protein
MKFVNIGIAALVGYPDDLGLHWITSDVYRPLYDGKIGQVTGCPKVDTILAYLNTLYLEC